MRQNPPPVLDYAEAPRARLWRALAWLMPLWSVMIIAAAYWPVRHGDDPYWYMAMLLPFIVGFRRAGAGDTRLGVYCLLVSAAVLLVSVLAPSWNR